MLLMNFTLCSLYLRLGMLWESLWRKQSCTTGTTWIFRIWWIPSRKRFFSGRCRFARTHSTITPRTNTTAFAACRMGSLITRKAAAVSVGFAAVCSFWPRLENFPVRTLPQGSCALWGPPHIQYRAPICMVWHVCKTWVFPWEKPMLAGRMARWSEAVFLSLNINPVQCSFSPQFKCCGWNNYRDWSWNLYFNCTQENPSYERCAVPHSCCIPIPGEVWEVFSSSSCFSLVTSFLPKTDKDIVCVTTQLALFARKKDIC